MALSWKFSGTKAPATVKAGNCPYNFRVPSPTFARLFCGLALTRRFSGRINDRNSELFWAGSLGLRRELGPSRYVGCRSGHHAGRELPLSGWPSPASCRVGGYEAAVALAGGAVELAQTAMRKLGAVNRTQAVAIA